MSLTNESRAVDPAFANILDNGFDTEEYSEFLPHIQPAIISSPANSLSVSNTRKRQERRIRLAYGLSSTQAALIASLYFCGVRS